jgi:hypothetical protein
MTNKTLTGLVTGPSLFSYIETISLPEHDDIADSNNFATLIADDNHNRYYDPERWLEKYIGVLRHVGWALYEDAIFTRTQHALSGSVAEFLVRSARDTRQGNAMIDTLDSLEGNTPALLSFDRETASGETFQVVPARYDARGFLNIAVFKLELSAQIKRKNFLFWSWERHSAKIVQRKAFLKLDRDELKKHRPTIDRRLAKELMERFDLSKNRSMNNQIA